VTRVAAALAVAVLASIVSAATAPAAVRMTHTLTIEGEFVNRWTMSSSRPCDVVGDGTLTVKFKTVKPVRVLPRKDRFLRGEVGGLGAWMIGFPLPPNGLRDMPDQRASGTITRVDNTSQLPPPADSEGPCDPPAVGKQGCGTQPLRGNGRPPRASLGRWDTRRIAADLTARSFVIGSCNSGLANTFDDTQYAANIRHDGNVLLDMPNPSAFKRRRVVRVTGTSRRRVSDDPGGPVVANDVTRKVTATFRRR
jgi:hypothetical protein